MHVNAIELKKFEFEKRIFVSFSIVILILFLSFVTFRGAKTIPGLLGPLAGLSEDSSRQAGYILVLLLLASASLLRMWAGSMLTSRRMMLFKVQAETLITSGPYRFVRNPIYLADFIAMCGFVFMLPPVGLLLPLLFYLHYKRLIEFEEENLEQNITDDYLLYISSTPRFFPPLKSSAAMAKAFRIKEISFDGLRHNALYILFIPGLVLAAIFDSVLFVFLTGIPAVVEWGYVHTAVGLDKKPHRVRTKKVFEGVLYAQCWEDPSIDRKAFNISQDDVLFSITSGGCNTLSFLLDNPKKIIALDLNPYQNYLLELKICSFRYLSYTEMLQFFGIRESEKRVPFYHKIRKSLSPGAQKFWDDNLHKIERGIIHSGRYEQYMRLLRSVLNVTNGISYFF